jgi:ACDE family multidrug resistance protein
LVLIFEGLAYLVGLFLAVVLIKLIDYRWSFLIFALFSIPAIIFYYKVKEETRFKSKKKSGDEKISTTLKWFLAADIIFNFALSSSFVLVMTFLVTDKYSGSIEWLAFLFGTLYLFMTLSTFTTKRFFDKKHLVLSTMLGMIIILVSTFLIIFSTNLYIVLIAMVLEGIGAGIWVPSQYAYYWKLTKPSQRETVSGYFNGIKSFVKALGPLVGGGIAAMFGILGPFYLKIIFAFIAIGIYVFVFTRVKHLK